MNDPQAEDLAEYVAECEAAGLRPYIDYCPHNLCDGPDTCFECQLERGILYADRLRG